MARVRVKIYNNSILASLFSLLGTGMAMCGVVVLVSGEVVPGISIAAIGFALSFLAVSISERKQFNTWKHHVEAEGMDQAIRSSTEIAIQAYNSYPGQRTLQYIQRLNPAAAEKISKELQNAKANAK